MDFPYPERSSGHRSLPLIDGEGEDEEAWVSGIGPAGTHATPRGGFWAKSWFELGPIRQARGGSAFSRGRIQGVGIAPAGRSGSAGLPARSSK